MKEGMRRRKVAENWLCFCILPGNLLWESRLLKDLSQIIELLSRYYLYNISPQSRVACCFCLPRRLFVCINMKNYAWWFGKTCRCDWGLGLRTGEMFGFNQNVIWVFFQCLGLSRKHKYAVFPQNIMINLLFQLLSNLVLVANCKDRVRKLVSLSNSAVCLKKVCLKS